MKLYGIALAIFAVVAAVPLCQSIPVQRDSHYVRLEGADATCEGADLVHGGTTEVEQLKSLCDQKKDCLGFSSNGMLKRDTSVGCQNNDLSDGAALFMKSVKTPQVGQLPVVPLPRTATMGTTSVNLATKFVFMTKGSDEVIAFMADIAAAYWKIIASHHSAATNTTTGLTGVQMLIDSDDLTLGLDTDESYSLSIPATGLVTITAKTAFGARHGLETFSQLVEYDLESGLYVVASTPIEVTDKPRFPHRGILLDSSRHYHSIATLKTFIRSLSHAKYNVFHWHIVDSQSFPLQLHTLPNIVKGAYTPGEIYTPEDVADIVTYAKSHGVRVIPEFDTPGHAASWCTGYPEICPSASCTQPLNPATNVTFSTISKLISECKGLFPDEYLHLGGDEVNTGCWTSTPAIKAWLDSKKYTTEDAYKYFVATTHALSRSLGRKSIHWEEVFNHFGGELDKDTIFQVWLSHATAAKIVASGYQCILSNDDVWYLDHLTITWEQFYANDPFMGITDPKQQALMLGGETCMWSETVDDSDLFNTVWPRAAAAAERLWSDQSVKDTDAFHPRLFAFRCLLNRRGISAAPTDNKGARLAPPRPGSCYSQ